MNPGVNYGQFKHKNAGIVEHDLKANVIKVNMSMALDFVMFDKAMEGVWHIWSTVYAKLR